MDQAQFEALSVKVEALEARMATLDVKVSKLLIIFERGNGAWWLMRWMGAFVVGCAAVWAVIGDHIHWK